MDFRTFHLMFIGAFIGIFVLFSAIAFWMSYQNQDLILFWGGIGGLLYATLLSRYLQRFGQVSLKIHS